MKGGGRGAGDGGSARAMVMQRALGQRDSERAGSCPYLFTHEMDCFTGDSYLFIHEADCFAGDLRLAVLGQRDSERAGSCPYIFTHEMDCFNGDLRLAPPPQLEGERRYAGSLLSGPSARARTGDSARRARFLQGAAQRSWGGSRAGRRGLAWRNGPPALAGSEALLAGTAAALRDPARILQARMRAQRPHRRLPRGEGAWPPSRMRASGLRFAAGELRRRNGEARRAISRARARRKTA